MSALVSSHDATLSLVQLSPLAYKQSSAGVSYCVPSVRLYRIPRSFPMCWNLSSLPPPLLPCLLLQVVVLWFLERTARGGDSRSTSHHRALDGSFEVTIEKRRETTTHKTTMSDRHMTDGLAKVHQEDVLSTSRTQTNTHTHKNSLAKFTLPQPSVHAVSHHWPVV